MGRGVSGAPGVCAAPPVITPGTELVMIHHQNTQDSLVLEVIQVNKKQATFMK